MDLRSAAVYVYLLTLGRTKRRSEWLLSVLENRLPQRLKGYSLTALGLWRLGGLALELTLVAVALVAISRVTSPLTTLSLTFASLLVVPAFVGLSSVGRTVIPPDQERLMLAPMSDRRARFLAFMVGSVPSLSKAVLVLPPLVGVVLSVTLKDEVVTVALWLSIALTMLSGFPLAFVVNRFFGALRVRRVQRGARGGSVVGYALTSTLAFGAGALMSRVVATWLSHVPQNPKADLIGRWLSALPNYTVEALLPLRSVLVHPASPAGALGRGATGDLNSLLIGLLWVTVAVLVAGLLWFRSGTLYRDEWRDGWQLWTQNDLFGSAEKLYLRLAGLLNRGDYLLEVQIRNLCRRREWNTASAFDLFGGFLMWVWLGISLGASSAVANVPEAAVVLALVVGGWAASEASRGPFMNFAESLTVDAEGRQAGLYRVAGVNLYELYRAKLRAGQIVGALPLVATLSMMAALAGLPPSSYALLALSGIVFWVLGPHVELLPSLISPHFGWDHPEELEDYYERRKLSSGVGHVLGIVSMIQLGLLMLLFNGWVSLSAFPWVASGVLAMIGVFGGLALSNFGRRVAIHTGRKDFPV